MLVADRGRVVDCLDGDGEDGGGLWGVRDWKLYIYIHTHIYIFLFYLTLDSKGHNSFCKQVKFFVFCREANKCTV